SVVASDIFGASGRDMLAALIAGTRDPKALAQLARGRMRAKRGVLEEAFTGHFSDHHGFLLAKMLARVDLLDTDIAELDRKLQELIAPFAHAVERLDEITGVGRTAARVIISEIGVDMGRFCPAGDLASWPGGRSSPPASRNRRARRRARRPPGTATRIWPGCLARPPLRPARPTPFSGNATGASPGAAAPRKPSSRSAVPSWGSSGPCCPPPTPASTISAPASTTPTATLTAPSATTSASSKHSAPKSPSNPPPNQHPPPTRPHRYDPAPLRSAGCCRLPAHR